MRINEKVRKSECALVLFDGCGPNDLNSRKAGVMGCSGSGGVGGGVGVAGGGGRLRSNQEGASTRQSHSGVGD